MELKDKKIELGKSENLAPHSFVNRKLAISVYQNFCLRSIPVRTIGDIFMNNKEDIKVLLAHIAAFAVFCIAMSLLMWLGTY